MSCFTKVGKVLLMPAVLWLWFCPPSALAELAVDTSAIAVHVDDVTGAISNVQVKGEDADSNEVINVLHDGDLLVPQVLTDAEENFGKIVESAKNGPLLVTTALPEQDLVITRRIVPGENPYSTRVSFEFQLQSRDSGSFDLSKLQFRFGAGFREFADPLGGYGSSIYAYRQPFTIRDNYAGVLEFEDGELSPAGRQATWLGWMNRYYVLALRQLSGESKHASSPTLALQVANSTDEEAVPEDLLFSVAGPGKLAPGETWDVHFEIIAAPKQRDLLRSIDPDLDGSVLINLWAWFRWVCFAIDQLLRICFAITQNWGLALIFLAMIIRILIIPVTRISSRYQEQAADQHLRMKTLADDIKQKYSGLELSQQIVDMHEREKFDHLLPFKGMLGLFIQIPILIALFSVIAEAPELSGASFMWIQDLALSDRLFSLGIDLPFFGGYFNLLPFVMAFVTIISTLYMKKSANKEGGAHSMLFGMAALFFVLFYTFPAGLVLYWTFSNVFQLVQQVIEKHFFKSGATHASA